MKGTFRYSFRWQLMISFLSVSLIPLLLCSLILLQVVSIRARSQGMQDLHTCTSQVLDSLDQISGGLDYVAKQLQENPDLPTALSGRHSLDTAIYNSLFAASEKIRSYCYLSVFDLSGNLCYCTNSTPEVTFVNPHWGILQAAQAADGNSVFVSHQLIVDGNSALLQGGVLLKSKDAQPIGYLVLEMNQGHFLDLLVTKFNINDDLLVLNRFWRTVYCSSPTLETTLAETVRSQLLTDGSLTVEDSNYLLSAVHHAPTGLHLMLQHPKIFNQQTVQMMHTVSMICVLICIVISVLVSLTFSRQISTPIRNMRQAFSKLEQDDLNVQLEVARNDELGQLARYFNQMVTVLRSNREESLRSQKALNEAQLRMLVAQLNPHFLCNTLDTMKWIGKINKIPEVALMATNLADILRFCISKEDFVPLRQELNVLKRYMEIQRIRLSDHFDFHIHIPAELEDVPVPKMFLQPIVENAIIHGLRGTDNNMVSVEAVCLDEAHMSIAVIDNGVGIPAELAGKQYDRRNIAEGNHLGLYNVDTILKIHYGADYGLFLDNGPDGTGTTVTTIIPMHKEEPSC